MAHSGPGLGLFHCDTQGGNRTKEDQFQRNGGCTGGRRQFNSKIVDRELVYNDELTASSGRLTQR
jgi:hypothetical protein